MLHVVHWIRYPHLICSHDMHIDGDPDLGASKHNTAKYIKYGVCSVMQETATAVCLFIARLRRC